MKPDKIRILKDLKRSLSLTLEDNLKEVVLFGSQLSDINHPYSDFDILIVLKNKSDWKTERKISDLCYDIDLKYNIVTDTHILSEEELDTPRGRQPIFINALNNGYHV